MATTRNSPSELSGDGPRALRTRSPRPSGADAAASNSNAHSTYDFNNNRRRVVSLAASPRVGVQARVRAKTVGPPITFRQQEDSQASRPRLMTRQRAYSSTTRARLVDRDRIDRVGVRFESVPRPGRETDCRYVPLIGSLCGPAATALPVLLLSAATRACVRRPGPRCRHDCDHRHCGRGVRDLASPTVATPPRRRAREVSCRDLTAARGCGPRSRSDVSARFPPREGDLFA